MSGTGLNTYARRLIRTIAAAALLALPPSPGFAWAQSAAPPTSSASVTGTAKLNAQQEAQLAWRDTLLAHQVASPGCFEAHFPDKTWKQVPCVTAANVPQRVPSRTPAMLSRVGAQPAGKHPLTIGGTAAGSDSDYMAIVDNGHTIDSATGSFANVTGLKTISSSSGSNGYFTLQLNTNLFDNNNKDVPTCSGAAKAVECIGCEQFVYTDGDDGDHGRLYIQYWMLNYNQDDCPYSWQQNDKSPGACFFNSPATSIPNPALSTFGQIVLGGAAANGGQDYVTLTTATGMYSTHAYDNVLNLSTHWSAAEFNVFGAGNGSEANFNTGVSIDVHLAVAMSPPQTLGCAARSSTVETANLFIQTPCTVTPAGNEIQFTEANGFYANGPLITGVSPNSVKATGGDPITITGMRLGNPASVTFDTLPVSIDTQHSNASQIVIRAPACSPLGCASGPGAVVSVTGPVGTPSAHMTSTSYGGPIAQTPNVLSVSPASGPELSTITVTGAGFYNGNPQFYIGVSPAANVNCPAASRNTQCSMTVPAQAGPAVVPISFGTPGGGSSSANWTYAGSAVPTIVSINPTHGPQAGGTHITLTGANFTQTMDAGFNDSYIGITGDCPTSTQCVIQSPRGQGQAYITVHDYTNGLPGSAPSSGSLFTYDVPPPSGTLRPTGGPAAGGTATEADLTSVSASANIAIQFNFSSGPVPISGAACNTSVLNAADAYCTFTSPPLPAGINPPVAVPVSVTEAGNILQLGNFTYEAPSPGSVSPDIGPRTGGTNVTVHVNHLLAGPGAMVNFTFNGTPTVAPNAACTVDAGATGNSTCTATTPPLPADETTPIRIPVSVTAQGQSVTVGNFQYGTKLPPPSQCVICREQGGTCTTKNGKFFCMCPKSSPTGACQ